MRFSSLALLLALVGCGGTKDGSPKPQIQTVRGIPLTVEDTTLRTGTVVFARNLVAGDTIVYRYFRNDSVQLVHRRVETADTAQLAMPALGQTASYRGSIQVERGGRNSGKKYPATQLSWAAFPYTRSAPDVVVDSIIRLVIRNVPKLDTVPRPGFLVAARRGLPYEPTDTNQMTTCAFGITRLGRRVKMQNSWNRAPCERAYRAWIAGR